MLEGGTEMILMFDRIYIVLAVWLQQEQCTLDWLFAFVLSVHCVLTHHEVP